MSFSKQWAGRAPGREWLDASPRNKCPVCGAKSWCQINREGTVALCKHNTSDRPRTNRDGVEFWVHTLDGAEVERATHERCTPRVERASGPTLNRAYELVLAELDLSTADREGLRARGLTDDVIDAGGYRTLPLTGRARIARVVAETIGEALVGAVPGIIRREDGGREWWSLGGAPGLVVPCRDARGSIFALKVRPRDQGDGPKYSYMSSSWHGGPSALAAVHVPLAARERLGGTLVVTEGELKADVSTQASSWAVVSMPGVGGWRAAVDFAVAHQPELVAIALDQDDDTNLHVAKATRAFFEALRDALPRIALWTWPRQWKGLDDYLTRNRTHEAA